MLKLFSSHIGTKTFQNVFIKTRNLLEGSLDSNIYFHHIPKCGGTSLNRALQSCYVKWSLWESSNVLNLNSEASWKSAQALCGKVLPPDVVDDSTVMKLREELLFYFMSLGHVHYLSGHFPFSALAHEHYNSKFDFITVLRDPVDRWLSSYFYNNYRQPSGYRKLSMSIEDYIDSNLGRSQGYEYAKFLGGVAENGNFMTPAFVQQAKDNLHKFNLIGFLDKMDLFKAQFERKYGAELRINTLNKRPEKEKSLNNMITEDMMASIRELCRADIEIYDYAVENFLKS